MEIWVVRDREGLIINPTHPYISATPCIAPKTTSVHRSQPYQWPLVNSSILWFTKNRYGASPPPPSSVPRPSYEKIFGDPERSSVDPQFPKIWADNSYNRDAGVTLKWNPPPCAGIKISILILQTWKVCNMEKYSPKADSYDSTHII